MLGTEPAIPLTNRFSVIDNGDDTYSIRDRYEDEDAPGFERAKYTDITVAQIVANRSNAYKVDGRSWYATDLGSIARYGIITDGHSFCAWDWLANELPPLCRPNHTAAGALRDVNRVSGNGPTVQAQELVKRFLASDPSETQLQLVAAMLNSDGEVMIPLAALMRDLANVR